MSGLIGTGLQYRQQAEALASKSDEMSRDRVKEETMKKQAKTQNQVSLATTGATVGTQIAPGWGTLIGAGVGYLAGSLFNE